jgi:trehalose/maltose transport system substrate-binding protein
MMGGIMKLWIPEIVKRMIFVTNAHIKMRFLLLVVVFNALLMACMPNEPVELLVNCGSNGDELKTCKKITDDFTAQTKIPVKIMVSPSDPSLDLSVFRELFDTETPFDVLMLDVTWVGILEDGLLDLNQEFSSQELSDFFPRIIENNTVSGKLKAIPWFTDAGMLFYRQDLLGKYGYDSPPTTWQMLADMAKRIQDGERRAGNDNFWGFVWQGQRYESLACNALEWIASLGGGTIIDADGNITINNASARKALLMARSWVGSITPSIVTEVGDEEWSRNIWQQGNAAFMRNWPYAYSLGNDPKTSKIIDKFAVAPLPRGIDGQPVATLGGWQLGVSRFSRHPKEAVQLLKFMTSKQSQKYRAVAASYNPTLRSLYKDPEVLAKNPFFSEMVPILENAVARPSRITGKKQDEVSTAFYTATNEVLKGEVDSALALNQLESTLKAIKGDGW